MNNDESFEAEVRATLEGLAREPAPERLVSRVAAIPSQEPAGVASGARSRPPFRNVVSGFAAIAAVLALAVAAVVLRSGEVPGVGASPSAPLPSSAATDQASAPAVVVTPVPSNLVLVPTPVPTPTAVAGDKVPAGFRPMSVTFVSADEGWVLGSVSCPPAQCPAIAHTLDGGRTWTSIPAPKTKIDPNPVTHADGSGINRLRFADARDGWAFGPELWATHDGGTTWKRLDVLPNAEVVELGSARGTVHLVAYDGDHDYRIASAPVGRDDWTVSALKVPVGGGPVPVIQLVLSGDGGWVLENDRTVTAGARLVDGIWRSWKPVCSDAAGPAFIGASTATDLVAACDVGQWSAPKGEHLYISRDGGTSFTEPGPRTPLDGASALATPSRSVIVIAGSDSKGTVLIGSFDGGLTWTTVHRGSAVWLTDLGFTTALQGVVISTGNAGGGRQLLMTRDGGRTWSSVTF